MAVPARSPRRNHLPSAPAILLDASARPQITSGGAGWRFGLCCCGFGEGRIHVGHQSCISERLRRQVQRSATVCRGWGGAAPLRRPVDCRRLELNCACGSDILRGERLNGCVCKFNGLQPRPSARVTFSGAGARQPTLLAVRTRAAT